MRPTEFTDDAIIEAGVQLQAEGANVTAFALRKRIGGGNPSRLIRVWHDYLATYAEPVPPAAELPGDIVESIGKLTDDMGSRVLQVVTLLNDHAIKTADRRVEVVERESAKQREQAERDWNEVCKALEESDQVHATLREDIAGLREELRVAAIEAARLQEQVSSEQKKNQGLNDELTIVRGKAESAMQLQGKVEALEQQNADLLAAVAGQAKAS